MDLSYMDIISVFKGRMRHERCLIRIVQENARSMPELFSIASVVGALEDVLGGLKQMSKGLMPKRL